jgi:cytidylate kinase
LGLKPVDVHRNLGGPVYVETGYSTERDNWWDTPEAKKFMAERKSDPSFDKKVDKKLAEIVRKGGAVINRIDLPLN